jgi:hypothetical protein
MPKINALAAEHFYHAADYKRSDSPENFEVTHRLMMPR